MKNLLGSIIVPCYSCGQEVQISQLKEHSNRCGDLKCANSQCSKYLEKPNKKLSWKQSKTNRLVFACSRLCMSTAQLLEKLPQNLKGQYRDIGQLFFKSLQQFQSTIGSRQIQEQKIQMNEFQNGNRGGLKKPIIPPIINKQISPINWIWDQPKSSGKIKFTQNYHKIIVNQEQYKFRTCIGNTGFTSGKHYWEFDADQSTEHEMKIGITKNIDFDLNSAFCDYQFGYAFYGVGQLRHGDNKAGKGYGKPFKKSGTLGVYLDMENGILAFSVDHVGYGPAFSEDSLKQGPIYPAISLLHKAGCTLRSGLKVPECFVNMKKEKAFDF